MELDDIIASQRVDQGNANIVQNINENADKFAQDLGKANALGVTVDMYRQNANEYNARITQEAIDLANAGPVMQEFFADRERQALIANEPDEYERLGYLEGTLAAFKDGMDIFDANNVQSDLKRRAERVKDPVNAVMSDMANDDMDEETRNKMTEVFRSRYFNTMQRDELRQMSKQANELALLVQRPVRVKAPEVLEKISNAQGWQEIRDAFLEDPLAVLGYTGGSSIGQQWLPLLASIPAYALGAPIGAGVAAFGGGQMEYQASLREYAQEELGYDFTDPKQIMAFMNNPEHLAAADKFASARQQGVVFWDYVAGLVAPLNPQMIAGTRALSRQVSRAITGRSVAPFKPTRINRAIQAIGAKSPYLSKVDTILSQATVGGILGAAGEYTAQQNAGQETNWGDVFLEAVGEFFTMPVEAGFAHLGVAMNHIKQQQRAAIAAKVPAVIEGLAKVAATSTLRTRSPEEFKATVEKMAGDGSLKEVFVKPGDLSQSARQAIAAISPEIAQAMEKAEAEGGVATIPMSDLLTALTNDEKTIKELSQHVRVKQDGMSAVEATQWMKENEGFLQRHFQEVYRAQVAKKEFRDELKTALAPLAEQLKQAHRDTIAQRKIAEGMSEADAFKEVDDVTRKDMRLFEMQIAHFSAMSGLSPSQFVQRFPIEVRAMFEGFKEQSLAQRVSPAKFSDAAINKGLAEDHRYTRKYASVEAMKMDAEAFEKNVSIMADITGMKQVVGRLRKPEKKAEAIIERMADNLLWIYNQMPEAIRERARLWYEGGHKSVILWANRYGIRPRQVAAIIAAYSPQNGWFNNFTQAERTLDIYFSDARDFKADDKLNARLKELCTGDDEARYETMKGKSLADLLAEGDLRSCAIWIRAYDSVFHDSRYRVQTPEGGVGNDWAKTAKGNNSRVVWMRYTPVIKALSILIDGSQANIDEQIGNDFKVRDFYNNLYDPTDERASTIDTHQVGANLLSVMSSNSREVTQNFGGVGSAGSVITGQKGTYAFHAEALARAAERVGVLPREMQSITWEGIRVLFPDVQKKSLRPKIEAIWKRHDKGEITLDQARQEILDVTGGFGKYAWEDTPFNDVPQPSYERGDVNLVHREEVVPEPVLAIEAAPDPRNAEAVAKWDELTADEKYTVTKNVVAYVLDRVALATKTRISEVGLQVGGWLGDVNFSATAEIADGGDAVGVAKLVARLLHQQAVMVISGTKQEGMFDSKVIEIKLPDGMTPMQIGDFYKTYIDSVKNEDGKSMVMGMSTANGIMRIVLDEGDDSAKILDALSKSIEGYPGADKIFVSVSDAFVSFASGEDANGQSSNSQGTPEGLASARDDHYDTLQGQVDQYFNEQVERAKDLRRGSASRGSSQLAGRSSELNQIIGPVGAHLRALFGLKVGAVIGLYRAKSMLTRMQREGKIDPHEIWAKTGWELGVDGKWRHEINDGQFKVDIFAQPQGKRLRLPEVFDAPDLYAAYPNLRFCKIVFDDSLNASGSTDGRTFTINIKAHEEYKKEANLSESVEELVRQTVLHELQHGIQDTEGLAQGSNPLAHTRRFRQLMLQIGTSVSEIGGDWIYGRKHVEDYFDTKASPEVVANLDALIKKLGYKDRYEFLINEMPAGQYWKVAGEVESRNVELRSKMTPEERAQKMISETEDVARKDQIIIRDGIIEMAKSPLGNELLQAAWHGSPHTFSEFNLDFIGSGEGAQVHGWGLYFAKSERVAVGYRERLTGFTKQSAADPLSKLFNSIEHHHIGLEPFIDYAMKDELMIDLENAVLFFDENSGYWGWFDAEEDEVVYSGEYEQFVENYGEPSEDQKVIHVTEWAKKTFPYGEQYYKDMLDVMNHIRPNGESKTAEDALNYLKQKKGEYESNVKALVEQSIIPELSKANADIELSGRVFKVDIPDNKVLLDEQKPLYKQSAFVRKALSKYFKAAEKKTYTVEEAVEYGLERYWLSEPEYKSVFLTNDVEKVRGLVQEKADIIKEGGKKKTRKELEAMASDICDRLGIMRQGYRGIAQYVLADIFAGIQYDIGFAKQLSGHRRDDSYMTGHQMYWELVYKLGSPKAASLELNSLGIKGITYDGYRDGRCFVIFDDQAIKILEFYQDQQDQRRASFDTETGVTSLFKYADESSFVHESGHYWLETMASLAREILSRDKADRMPGEQAIIDTLDGFLKWLGQPGDTAEERIQGWLSAPLDARRGMHEQFARGYEAYLRRGKAPTSGLRKVFEAFTAWLKRIYADAMELDVEMTDEVAALYDRLFMAEAEAESVKQDQHIISIFPTARAAGMSDEDFAKLQEEYKAVQNAIEASIRANREKNHRLLRSRFEREKRNLQAEYEKLENKHRKALEKDPVYVAWKVLTEPFEEGGVTFYNKLSLAEVRRMADEDTAIVDAIQAKGLITNIGQRFIPIQVLSDMVGATDAKQLLIDLADALPLEEEVVERAEAEFMQKYGNLPDDDGIGRSALIALAAHDPAFSNVLEKEYNALAKLTGGRKLVNEGARMFATKQVGEVPVKNLMPLAHARAEARAGKDAQKAFNDGDLVSAAIHKRNQVVQHHIARAGYEARAEIAKGLTYVKKVLKSKTIWGSYMEQIENLAARYNLAKLDVNNQAKDLKEFIADEEIAIDFDDFITNRQDPHFQVHYSELSVDEFREVIDTIKALEKLGRDKDTVIKDGKRQKIADVVNEINESIAKNAKEQGKNFKQKWEQNTPGAQKKQSLLRFMYQHTKIAAFARVMDGDTYGALWNTIIKRANECGDKETEMRSKLTHVMQEILQPVIAMGGMHTDTVVLPKANRPLTRQERIAFALNWGNDGNRQRLKDGFGIDDQEAQVILRSLTETEWRAVEQIWQVFETLRPQMEALEIRLYGRAPRWVEYGPFEVTTKEGRTITVSGGYYPAVYDTDANERSQKHQDMKQAEGLMNKAVRAVSTDRSHMKKRAAKVDRPMSLRLSNAFDALNNEVHDICWREFVIDTQKIMNGGVADTISGYYDPNIRRQFRNWLADIALGDQRPQEGCSAILSHIRQGVGLAGLGFNVVSALSQMTGLVASATRLGNYVGVGVNQYVRDPVRMTREVADVSLFMKNRGLTRFRELNEVNALIRNADKKVEQYMDKMRGGGYFMLLKVQQVVDTITWLGAYQQALDNGETIENARALADQVVIDTQGSGMVKDLSEVERSQVLKIFTVFYSFMNNAFNLNVTAFFGDRNRYRAAAKIITISLVMPTIESLLRAALPVVGDDDDDDETTAKMMQKAAADVISFNMGTIVVVRELQGLANAVSGGPIWNYQGPSGLRLINDVMKAGTQLFQFEFDVALVKSLVNLGGSLFGLPAAQINRSITTAEAYSEGKIDGIDEVAQGILFGVSMKK